jgi:phage shock protein PspC (stress-responsive transcriptional regulator)
MNRLYRSVCDRKITGLCGGLAASFGISSTLLRLLLVIAALCSGGSVILLYLLASWIVPSEFRSPL